MKSHNEATHFWNNRFKKDDFVYGKRPNVFFREQLNKCDPGVLLLPAEGEGRNAVYAARQGWEVHAFDISKQGKSKALQLAENYEVSINYTLNDFESYNLPSNNFDVIGLIYAHMHDDIRRKVHRKLIEGLKPGGKIILEAFNESQLGNSSGGPKSIDMLYSRDKLKGDFEDLNILSLQTIEAELSEGAHHKGKANLVRLLAKKPAQE
jgi:2-polyprenyl-3-methyl-5-hydroxy-6-metoxy-1,4-benzoquinol methylase